MSKFSEVIDSIYRYNGLISNSNFEKILIASAIDNKSIPELVKLIRKKDFSFLSDGDDNPTRTEFLKILSSIKEEGLTTSALNARMTNLMNQATNVKDKDEGNTMWDIVTITSNKSEGDDRLIGNFRNYDIKTKMNMTELDSTISTYEWHHPHLNYANRNVLGPEIMLTSLPNIEISRAVPYFDCKLVVKDNLPSKETNQDGRDFLIKEKSISLYKYLVNGSIENNSEGDNVYKFINATPVDMEPYNNKDIFGQEQSNVYAKDLVNVSGMELFTTPQVINNHDSNYLDLDYTMNFDSIQKSADNVVDKFRPFMTFQSFNIQVTPATGMLATKSAELKITLHDRSRLNQIVPFITPGGVGNVEFVVEYGWSHPDNDPEKNPYGALINAMRTTEKYGVMNSSYSFTEDGQVDISLKLYTKGATNATFDLVTALDNNDKHPVELLKDLTKAIRDAKSALNKNGIKLNAEMGAPDILGKISSVKGLLSLEPNQIKEINNFINGLKKMTSNQDISELFENFSATWDGAQQVAGDFVNKLETYYTTVINRLVESDEDPWIEYNTYLGINPQNFVSLNKILLEMVAKPLMKTGQFDDVQFHFYPLNEYAMWGRELTVGQYPINKKRFKDYMLGRLKHSPSMTIQKLLNYIKQEFINNKADVIYGLSNYYEKDDEGKWELKDKWTESDKKKQEFALKKNKIMSDCYGLGQKTFKMPKIHMDLECVEAVDELGNIDQTKTVLKLHFFDAAATSYGGFAQLWDASLNTDLGVFGSYTKYKKAEPVKPKKSYDHATWVHVPDIKFAPIPTLNNDANTEFQNMKSAIKVNFSDIMSGWGTNMSIKKGNGPNPVGNITSNLSAKIEAANDQLIKALWYVDQCTWDGTSTKKVHFEKWDASNPQGIDPTGVQRQAMYFLNCMKRIEEYYNIVKFVMEYWGTFDLTTIKDDFDYDGDPPNSWKSKIEYAVGGGLGTNNAPRHANWNSNGEITGTFVSNKELYTVETIKSYHSRTIYRNWYRYLLWNSGKQETVPNFKSHIINKFAPSLQKQWENIFNSFGQVWRSWSNVSQPLGLSSADTPQFLEIYDLIETMISIRMSSMGFGSSMGVKDSDWNSLKTLINQGWNLGANVKTPKTSYSRWKTAEQKRYEQLMLERQNRATLYEDQMLQTLKYFYENDIIESIMVKQKDSKNPEAQGVEVPKFRIKAGGLALRTIMSEYMPTLKYGASRSGIINAQLSTMSNPAMETIHMQRQNRTSQREVGPYDDGVPLLVKPVELSLDTFGCPFLAFGQQYFVDFNTNTSVDDIYIVTGLSHEISPGNFKSSLKLMPMNKLGKFRSMIDNIDDAIAVAKNEIASGERKSWIELESLLQDIKNFDDLPPQN